MLRTPLCDLLGIQHPVMQAAIAPATAPELVAAVSNAGGLGSLAAIFESAESLERLIARVRELTDRPFAVNHVVPLLDEDAFALTLEAKPAVISLAVGERGDLIERARAAGATVIQQVHTVHQARQAAERGVDAIIAQGSEAGGQGLAQGPSSMVLIPQVVDVVGPIPVLAAGGIADGRGLAAALVLGAQGVNIGTRFLAAEEAAVADGWKRAILSAESEDAVRFEVWSTFSPHAGPHAFAAVPRVLRTPFVDAWRDRAGEAARRAEELRAEVMTSFRERRSHELVPFAGQSAGLVHDIRPAGEIVRSLVAEAERALSQAPAPAATCADRGS